MPNFYKNLVYFTRKTNITLTELSDWPYIDYERYVSALSEQLEQEARDAKKREEQARKQYKTNSMASQMRSMMSQFKHK